MKQEEYIYLDKEGYEDYLQSIENLKNNLTRIEEQMNILKSKDFNREDYEELLELKERLLKRIIDKTNNIHNIKINDNINDDLINVGDTVRIRSYYDIEDVEEELCELVVGESVFGIDVSKLSINSPKGEILYRAKVGDTKYYQVHDEKIRVDILEKINVKKLIKSI